MKTKSLTGLAALAIAAAAAPAASAATVVRSCDVFACEPTLTYSASPGERNDVENRTTGGSYGNETVRFWLLDRGARIELGEADGAFRGNGCERPQRSDPDWPYADWSDTSHVVVCRWGRDGTVQMSLGDADDRARVALHGGTLHGGSGNDDLYASLVQGTYFRGGGTLYGESGHDRLQGASGADRLLGGAGDDQLHGDSDADVLRGGDGRDTVSYLGRLEDAAVRVTVGDGANDGGNPDGHGDDVGSDVEVVVGGIGNDVLIGDAGANTLIGLSGDDTLDGGAGEDRLEGGGFEYRYLYEGSNTLSGGDGRDELVGGNQADTLDGGAGADTLIGDDLRSSRNGRDILRGGAGDDALDGGRSAVGDDVSGGDDVDTISYGIRAAAVTVSLDGLADDGAAGEGDLVRADVERVIGGAGNDRLTGSAAANMLIGGPGDDLLRGLDGADTFIGVGGTDTVTYDERKTPVAVSLNGVADDGVRDVKTVSTEGDDVQADVEVIVGTPFGDLLTGGPGANTLDGRDGDDELHAADGFADTVLGGAGFDGASVDKLDVADEVEALV